MSKQLTGPALVAYLRDNPTSDAMRAAADEIERLQEAIRALLAERDALRDAVEALLANPSGMYCDGYPEAERKARAALAQENADAE